MWPACRPQVDQGDRGYDDRGANKKQPAAGKKAFANETTLAPFDGTDSSTLTLECTLDKDNREHQQEQALSHEGRTLDRQPNAHGVDEPETAAKLETDIPGRLKS